MISILGFLAGTLTTISFLPQVHKTWRTGRSDDLSWGMLLIFSLGVLLWLIYGLVLHEAPIIAANAATLVLLIAIVVMKAKQRSL
ncbi:MAG TPA: SemiSWEET transporter [Candidatus Angelobacter sp.]|nr:SemiSWEET transporter [Candidatus Angelobacter sp.]